MSNNKLVVGFEIQDHEKARVFMDQFFKMLQDFPEKDIEKGFSVYAISKEDVFEDSDFLDCLRAAGVDNWEGYDEAIEMMNPEED